MMLIELVQTRQPVFTGTDNGESYGFNENLFTSVERRRKERRTEMK